MPANGTSPRPSSLRHYLQFLSCRDSFDTTNPNMYSTPKIGEGTDGGKMFLGSCFRLHARVIL